MSQPEVELPQETDAGEAGTQRAEKLTRQERCLQLAQARYELRRAAKWPYLLHGGRRYLFSKADRQDLRADLRYAWREKWPDEAPPPDAALNSVLDDLKRIAAEVEPDEEDERDDISGATAADGEDRGDGLDLVTTRADCPLPSGYRMPEGFEVTGDGIWYMAGRWGPSRVSWAWLFPVRVYVDPDGDQLVELVWLDRGRWVSRLVRKSVSKSGRKLVTETGDAGLPVTDSEARDAERWIAAAEAVNAGVIPRHPVARQLGWQNDGHTFITARDSPWRVEPKYPQQVPSLKAHHPHGTLGGWQAAIKHAEGYPVVQTGIYESLAAPLLEPLNLDSFTSDLNGKSSRGKTITRQAGLSCWADPSEKGDGLFSWQTTVIEAERRFNLVNGLFVVLDETRLVKDPDIVDTVLYMVPKNHGKPRGGGYPNMIPWRVIVGSTGEQPATSFTTHQGASARVLSIQRPPFGTEGDSSRTAAEALKHGIEANYGTAGPAFIARLQTLLADKDGAARLRKRHTELTGKLRGDTDMTGRRAPLIAVIALAAELSAAWGITPFKVPAPGDWMAMYTSADDPRDNRPEMALDVVREYIASHQDKLLGVGDDDHPPAAGWIGTATAKEGPALLPEKLREEMKRRSYELDAVIPGWLEMGALVVKDSQRPKYLVPRRLGGRMAKLLIFRNEVINPDDGDEE